MLEREPSLTIPDFAIDTVERCIAGYQHEIADPAATETPVLLGAPS
jgi:hypothetical protein